MKKNINILLYHLDQGGVEKTAVELANDLVGRGHEVTITSLYKFKPEKFEISHGIKLRNIFGFYFKGMDRIIKLFPINFLYKLVNNDTYDVEVAFQADLPTKIIANSKNKHSRKYAWIHGIGMKFTEDYNKFDKIFFVGEDLMKFYLKDLPPSIIKKSEVFYNSLDIESINEQALVSVNFNQNNFDYNVVSVGRLSKEKCFDKLIKSVIRIRKKTNYNIGLVIVGEGDERQTLEQLIRDNSCEQYIRLVGFDKNPYRFIYQSDIYACTSSYEGFNVAVSESILLDKPIVMTNVFGANELIETNSSWGQIVNSDVEGISEGIVKIIETDADRAQKENPIKNKLLYFLSTRENMLIKYFDD